MSEVVDINPAEPEAAEEFGVDDLITREEQDRADQAAAAEAEASTPDNAELERARALADRINTGFLWSVDRFVCPDVDIKQTIDQEAGVEALTPLALEWGGQVPPWLLALYEQYKPYIAAGTYMGVTLYTAHQLQQQADQEKAREPEQADNGA